MDTLYHFVVENQDNSAFFTTPYLDYKEIVPSVKVSEDKIRNGEKIIKWRKYNKKSKPVRDHPWRTYKRSDYHIDITDFEDIASKELLAEMA
jgi:hypothetical protein